MILYIILVNHIKNTIVMIPRQKACIRRDGISDNIFVLKNIIYQH